MSLRIQIRTAVSLDSPELQPYRTLRRPVDHFKEGIFVAEGEKVVRRLLSSGLHVLSLLLTEEWFGNLRNDGALSKLTESTTAFVAKKELVETIVGYNLHQGIMAIGKVPTEQPLRERIESSPQPYFIVALDGLVNAENVGMIVRNCAAFGVDMILVGQTSSSPYLRRAVRNSMGAVFRMPIVHSRNLSADLMQLRALHKTSIVAAHLHDSQPIATADFRLNLCVVFGNEGDGVSPCVLDACDMRVGIPMMNGTDSLNVASASAVFLHEVRRQRQVHG